MNIQSVINILLFIILMILICRSYTSKQENFEVNDEAIRNIASIYNNENMKVTNLETTSGTTIGGDIILNGSGENKWIFHVPADDRRAIWIAPHNGTTWDWDKALNFNSAGDLNIGGKLNVAGDITSGGTVNVGHLHSRGGLHTDGGINTNHLHSRGNLHTDGDINTNHLHSRNTAHIVGKITAHEVEARDKLRLSHGWNIGPNTNEWQHLHIYKDERVGSFIHAGGGFEDRRD